MREISKEELEKACELISQGYKRAEIAKEFGYAYCTFIRHLDRYINNKTYTYGKNAMYGGKYWLCFYNFENGMFAFKVRNVNELQEIFPNEKYLYSKISKNVRGNRIYIHLGNKKYILKLIENGEKIENNI